MEVFNDIYGEHYSKSSISRMLDYLRRDVTEWLECSLESYYHVVFIDCVHIKIHRKRSVDTEAFYVILAVKEDKTREVLGIYNKPTENALGWGEMLNDLYERGVSRIGPYVRMVSSDLMMASAKCFPASASRDAPPT